eukprot:jgi/Tetstr1/420376/TSEL_001043.t1
MGDLSAAEERIYEEREDARTIAGGLRKETTPRHERFDGATSIWTEWFSSFNANVLVPYAFTKRAPRSAPRADGAGFIEGERHRTGVGCSAQQTPFSFLQEYVEINAVTRPIIDQWQKDTLRYQQQTLRFDPASGRIRVPSREDADAFHEFRYRRYVELFETKFNEAPKMRTRYDAYTALKQSLDAGFHQLKDIAVLRQSHEDRLDEIAGGAQAEVAVGGHGGGRAMEARPEADEDRAGTLAGWDAQREQLTKQPPQGFEPAVEQEAPASYEGRRGGGAITSDMLDIRNQQLLQHLRTAL